MTLGNFDGIFQAKVLGIYKRYGFSPRAALISGAQVPLIDPSLAIPGMAAVKKKIKFVAMATS